MIIQGGPLVEQGSKVWGWESSWAVEVGSGLGEPQPSGRPNPGDRGWAVVLDRLADRSVVPDGLGTLRWC